MKGVVMTYFFGQFQQSVGHVLTRRLQITDQVSRKILILVCHQRIGEAFLSWNVSKWNFRVSVRNIYNFIYLYKKIYSIYFHDSNLQSD